MTWPEPIATDIKAFVTADAIVEADLHNATTQTVSSLTAWSNQLATDIGKLNAAVEIVRAELGLPPSTMFEA